MTAVARPVRNLQPPPALGRLAGVAGIASALASAAWLAGAAPAAGFPDRWIAIWNLLLLPVAAWLGIVLVRSATSAGRAWVAAAAGAAGIGSCLLWATSSTTADLEWVWIGLSAVWWLGSGALLVDRGSRRLGWFTIGLGAFAVLDATVTYLGDEGIAFLLASPKLPLGWVWALLVGARLLVDPLLEPDSR